MRWLKLIELLGVLAKNRKSLSDERAERILETTTRRVGESWETGLLWKNDEASMPESSGMGFNRLRKLEQRLDRDARFAVLYYGEMERLINNGYAREVRGDELAERTWYLPHFGVFNPNKPSRVRLVFDAAAKVRGSCLNDYLLKGPDLLQPLLAVLMKFREQEIGVKGDISDMFLRVKGRRQDRDAQRFLWRGKDRVSEPQEYVMESLVFGVESSPCSAIHVKNKNAEEFSKVAPEAASSIVSKSYMDDYLAGCDTEAEAIELVKDVRRINQTGGFHMHVGEQ